MVSPFLHVCCKDMHALQSAVPCRQRSVVTVRARAVAPLLIIVREIDRPVPPLVIVLPVAKVQLVHPLAEAKPAPAQVGALPAHLAPATLALCGTTIEGVLADVGF